MKLDMQASSAPADRCDQGGHPALVRLFAKEIGISILINIIFNLVFALLLFDRTALIPLWGPAGIAIDLVPATFMPALMMTFGITLGLRNRIRQGKIMPYRGDFPALPLPGRLPLRALAIAMLAVSLIVPPVLGIIILVWTGPWSWTTFIGFKVMFSVLHASLVTPFVVMRALRAD